MISFIARDNFVESASSLISGQTSWQSREKFTYRNGQFRQTRINNTAISGEYLFFHVLHVLHCTFSVPERTQENSITAPPQRHLNSKIGKDRDKQRLSQIGSSASVRNESGARDLTMPWHVFQYLAIMTFRRAFCPKSPRRIGN